MGTWTQVRRLLLLFAAGLPALPQTAPEYADLDAAFRALRERDYDAAVASFRRASALAPARAGIRKDLAYALLKQGETVAARDEFAAAMQLAPGDAQVELEYAFLAHETGERRLARLVFDRLRQQGNSTAAQAFQSIDQPLAESIGRWQAVVAADPANFSATRELAELLEARNDLAAAAAHWLAAWRLRPDNRRLLVSLGRTYLLLDRPAEANAALLAASRASEPRAAEMARELLPSRYPYVSEFEQALELDPSNAALRRELGFLLLELGRRAEAERAFGQNAADGPSMRQLAALRGVAPTPLLAGSAKAREMGFRSYEAGYLNDALRYLTAAHQEDPLDFAVMLQLGWTLNLLKRDREALAWFTLAARSPDTVIAEQARKAVRNLSAADARVSASFWLLPVYSTRWHSGFGYAQARLSFRAGRLPFRPYLSTRFVGDTAGSVRSDASPMPQYLSETAVIPGFGITTGSWRGLRAWAEAGLAVSYMRRAGDARTRPDYRGGLSLVRARGRTLWSEHPGWFADNSLDGVYLSRFNRSFLIYSQGRGGYMTRIGGAWLQLGTNFNLTAAPKGQYWANYVEFGPGLRFRFDGMPRSMYFVADFVRGVYTVNRGNPRGPNFWDFRLGMWYAAGR